MLFVWESNVISENVESRYCLGVSTGSCPSITLFVSYTVCDVNGFLRRERPSVAKVDHNSFKYSTMALFGTSEEIPGMVKCMLCHSIALWCFELGDYLYSSAIFKTICVDFGVASTKLVKMSKAKLTKWMAMLLLNSQPMQNEKTLEKLYIL
jgi:hypothetical protein